MDVSVGIKKRFTNLTIGTKLMLHFLEKLYSPHSGLRHLSTIPLKDSHLFKIAEPVIKFYLKKISEQF